MAGARMPRRIGLRVLPGWPRRIERAAERADTTPPEWLRDVVRRALETSERLHRDRRARQRDTK